MRTSPPCPPDPPGRIGPNAAIQLAAGLYLGASAMIDRTPGGKPDPAMSGAAFDASAASGPAGYRILGLFRAAAARAEAGDLAGASTRWNQISADASADPLLRDLASLKWCIANSDEGDPGQLQARLNPLILPGNSWRALAQEQLALLDLRQGRGDEAKAKLKKLVEDTTAPNGVRGRASALVSRIGE